MMTPMTLSGLFQAFIGLPLFQLLVSFGVDSVGTLLGALPAVGQVVGFVWAPISSFIIYKVYDDALLTGTGLLEEMIPIPLLSSLPTATLAWLRRYWKIPVRFVCGWTQCEDMVTVIAKRT